MKARGILLIVTTVAGVGLLAGLGVLMLGSPDQIARVPASGLLFAALATLSGTIYLQASKPAASTSQKLQSTLSTIGFAILVVIAVFLIGFAMSF
jgi:hypothetical protein